MKAPISQISKHALDRVTARSIPVRVIELVLDYGEPTPCRDGGSSYALTKASYRKIKRDWGPHFSNALATYRNVYVVCCSGTVVTVAWSRRSLKAVKELGGV